MRLMDNQDRILQCCTSITNGVFTINFINKIKSGLSIFRIGSLARSWNTFSKTHDCCDDPCSIHSY